MTAAVLAALLACPAGPGSRTPRLSPAPDGLLLSWQEPAGKGMALKLSRWDGKSWSKPGTVARGGDLLVNGADFPSVVALSGGGYAAQWIRAVKGGDEASEVVFSTSTDGSAWAAPRRLHRDASATEHGFATMAPGSKGRFTAVWLDGRAKAGAGGAQALYAAEWDGAALGPEKVLDARVCDCCATAAAAVADGVLVAYRDRTEKETRDISVAALRGGVWSAPRPVSGDGWTIEGCPVNGPALAAAGKRAVLAWYTAAGDAPAVKAAVSMDGGATFGPGVRLDAGAPSGRVDAVLLEDGSAVVSWLEGGGLRGRRLSPEGAPGAVFAVSNGEPKGSPRLAVWGGRAFAAWTDGSGEEPRVRLTAVGARYSRQVFQETSLPSGP